MFARKFTIKERLENLSELVTESGCQIWTGAVDRKGYGKIKITEGKYKRINRRAHKVSYEEFKEEVPEGMFVCHSCDVTSCINPDHLWLGTYEDNMRDAIAKGRIKRIS